MAMPMGRRRGRGRREPRRQRQHVPDAVHGAQPGVDVRRAAQRQRQHARARARRDGARAAQARQGRQRPRQAIERVQLQHAVCGEQEDGRGRGEAGYDGGPYLPQVLL